MDGVQLAQGYSHVEEAVYFLPLSSQKFLVPILSTPKGWKAELSLEPPSGFEKTFRQWRGGGGAVLPPPTSIISKQTLH